MINGWKSYLQFHFWLLVGNTVLTSFQHWKIINIDLISIKEDQLFIQTLLVTKAEVSLLDIRKMKVGIIMKANKSSTNYCQHFILNDIYFAKCLKPHQIYQLWENTSFY